MNRQLETWAQEQIMDNRDIANRLSEHAHHLECQGANLFRIRAYRRAAEIILSLDRQASEIYEIHGRNRLKDFPGIGPHLSSVVESLITTGKFHAEDEEENHEATCCVRCG